MTNSLELCHDEHAAHRDGKGEVGGLAGGVLDEIYAYPGGRRFTFTDPDGNRLGVFESAH